MYQYGASKNLLLAGVLSANHVTAPATITFLAALIHHTGASKIVQTYLAMDAGDDANAPKVIIDLWRSALHAQSALFKQHGAGLMLIIVAVVVFSLKFAF